MQKIWKTIGIILMIICSFCGCKKDEAEILSLEEAVVEDVELEEEQPETIFVYVCGAVVNEGVYELPAGSRRYEAIELAGGFTEIAATTEVNQAAVLTDEETIYVPNYSEAVQTDAKEDGKVNVNTATEEELMTLPGVGESKAKAIVSYREENGGFKTVEEIMEISGIKEGLFNKIKDYIKI